MIDLLLQKINSNFFVANEGHQHVEIGIGGGVEGVALVAALLAGLLRGLLERGREEFGFEFPNGIKVGHKRVSREWQTMGRGREYRRSGGIILVWLIAIQVGRGSSMLVVRDEDIGRVHALRHRFAAPPRPPPPPARGGGEANAWFERSAVRMNSALRCCGGSAFGFVIDIIDDDFADGAVQVLGTGVETVQTADFVAEGRGLRGTGGLVGQ